MQVNSVDPTDMAAKLAAVFAPQEEEQWEFEEGYYDDGWQWHYWEYNEEDEDLLAFSDLLVARQKEQASLDKIENNERS